MNRLKGIIYDIITWLASKGLRNAGGGNKLLVVRVDEIGDYMLWRNFWKEIARAPQYKGYTVHFCGNQSWKWIFQCFDASLAQHTSWLNKPLFKTNMWYRYRFLKQVYRQNYTIVINPTFSRDKRYDDSIVKAARARHRLGMVANTESIQPYEMGYDHYLYTRWFQYAEKPLFEFYRNRLFTEFITGKISEVHDTQVPAALLPSFEGLPENYFVVFPGSRSKTRIWPTEHFIAVSNFICQQYGYTAVVCGTGGDTVYTQAFCTTYSYPCIDLTGKTSLTEMLAILKKSKLLLSVDTGSLHLAAAAGCAVYGVFNGSQYKRFAPYPKEIAPEFYTIYPDEVEAELQNPEMVQQKYEFVINISYASVPADKLIACIRETHAYQPPAVVGR